ncbi:cell wall metabolism sensor histidine kinase WalK [Psychrobacter sp. DAB_AL32B]|uniref:sensor histidine kinase n=1 Tax=Psychrobacter sp. DAB_AL32B TaxID=1028414 RepID=UPI0020C5B1F6|nr:ATP-binding protein [Psychrobacter sp. DAB_AL32B]
MTDITDMTKMTGSSIEKPKFRVRITLFWRLFLSLLLMILITSILSISVERWLNERELATRMDSQIEKLLTQRERLVTSLQAGDLSTVKQVYNEDRRLMSQIRIYDEQGAIIFPRYRFRESRGEQRQAIDSQTSASSENRGSVSDAFDHKESDYSKFSNKARADRNPYSRYDLNSDSLNSDKSGEQPFSLNHILQPKPSRKAIANADSSPELADMMVVLPDEQTVIIQLRPHLLFKDVLELQRGNFTLRLGLIILFSVLVCFWLSRTMTQRIRRVQHTVHRMLVGDYQVNPSLSRLGTDELGLLAKDVAQLSTRLADSELARKQMLSDISHELRSPLARLDVATELTRDFAPHADRYLDRIDKESARMNELIEQIIRIQSLQMQQYTIANIENETVDICEIISEIGKDVCFEFQHKNVHWQWQPNASLSRESCTVIGNQEQLYSALENIIRNAFMHTAVDSTVMADIQAVKMNNQTSAIQISIIDEGGGVAEQDLERIFQPFVRLDSARHRETGGYGLGLAIVYAVVMAHKGQVGIYNRKDDMQGLIVQLTIPVK